MEDEKKSKIPGFTGNFIGKMVDSGIGGVIPMLIDRFDKAKGAESAEEKRRREQAAAGVPSVGAPGMKKGGKVKAKASSASKRADGCAQRGKTRGRFV